MEPDGTDSPDSALRTTRIAVTRAIREEMWLLERDLASGRVRKMSFLGDLPAGQQGPAREEP
jgi:hypothetical protein